MFEIDYLDRWLLPAGITDILPQEAFHLEALRRKLIDLCTGWGYELVIPPMVEYLDSLLVGAGDALDLQTFKLIDQLTGRLMGVHADMTPQVARIDAHRLKRQWPTRLCYLETVLHTRPNNFAGSRSPLQVGAELYGYAGIAGDVEIISLMLAALETIGITDFHIDIGHVGIYQALLQAAQLTVAQEKQLSHALRHKASTEINTLLSSWQVPKQSRDMLNQLVYLHGDETILKEAHHVLATAPPAVQQALADLEQIQTQLSQAKLYFDLAESRGYSYHTGIVFAAYVAKHGQAIAKGGRYDNLSEFFSGQKRPATGFSTNLITLMSLLPEAPARPKMIFAPAVVDDPTLTTKITQLRQKGHIVVCGLPNQPGDAQTMECDWELRSQAGEWQVVAL